MTVIVRNNPTFKYTIAATGEPGVGYKLFTYEEGTSTKKTTWTSLAKTATNTNPIILDANGEADVWIDGNYKFVLAPPTDTDPPTSPVKTWDALRSEDPTPVSASTNVSSPINGSFEVDSDSDGVPDNWSVVELAGGSISVDSTSSSHGTDSLKFTSTGAGGGEASTDDYYEVEAGKKVGVHFSIISADVNTLNKVEVYWYNSSKVYLSASTVYNDGATNPTTWTRKYSTATAPATAKYARIVLTGVAAASSVHSSTNFDNIELDTGLTGELTPSIQLDLNNLTATAAELNTLDGITSTTAELNYSTGVTSAIQTQINGLQTQINDVVSREGALVYKTGNQLIAVSGLIAFGGEEYDDSAIHDTVTNNNRLTVPSGVSKVRLKYNVTLQSSVADGIVTLTVQKNGVATYAGVCKDRVFPAVTVAATNMHLIGGSPVLNVSPGDYFNIAIAESSTGDITVIGGADQTWFSMEIVE